MVKIKGETLNSNKELSDTWFERFKHIAEALDPLYGNNRDEKTLIFYYCNEKEEPGITWWTNTFTLDETTLTDVVGVGKFNCQYVWVGVIHASELEIMRGQVAELNNVSICRNGGLQITLRLSDHARDYLTKIKIK